MSNDRLESSLPDPLRRYSTPLFTGFVRYLNWYVKRHFNALLVSLDGLPVLSSERPLIIYSNHPSWWDPLIFVLISRALFPARRSYGPMEAQSLKRYPILERVGAFAVELDSARGGMTFMIQARRILGNADSVLWLTAEGAFTDVRQRPVRIRQGLGYLARMTANIVVMPMSLEYAFWNESRPVVLCRFGEPIDVHGNAESRSAAEWNDLFEHALSKTMERLATESIERDPARFRPILRGSNGVGGLYDVWRRVRAWSHGQSFNASHEQQK